jgi:hypothetical protein
MDAGVGVVRALKGMGNHDFARWRKKPMRRVFRPTLKRVESLTCLFFMLLILLAELVFSNLSKGRFWRHT